MAHRDARSAIAALDLGATTAGSAQMAGLATGWWEGLDAIGAPSIVGRVWEPMQNSAWREGKLAGWGKSVTRELA